MSLNPQTVYDVYRKDVAHDMHPFSPFLRQNARGNILEIGVRAGVSTAALLLGLEKNGGHLWSVDKTEKCGELYAGHPQWTFIWSDSVDFPQVSRGFAPLISEYINSSPFRPCATDFDIVLLDGAHHRMGIRSDLLNYGALVKKGGILLAHDIFGTKDPTPEQIADDWPTEAVGEEFHFYTKVKCWPTLELPGEFGMGVAIRIQ